MKQFSNLTIMLLLVFTISLTACGGSSVSAKEISQPAGDPVAGQDLFKETCTACHGQDGRGLPGLGKNLASSEFIINQNDQELVEFIKIGRDPDDPLNTTGVTMPPQGGNAALSNADLYDIVAHIRAMENINH